MIRRLRQLFSGNRLMGPRKRRLFCEISPFAYAISLRKGILVRHLKNLLGRVRFARTRQEAPLPVVVSSHGGDMIKRGPGIDPQLQANKADNIRLACSRISGILIRPGETFSFWRLVGKTTRRNGFKEGRVIINGRLVSGVGGGLCNLANTIHLLVLDSPLTVTELHHHSDALAPDPDGRRVPYSAGTSVNYNFVDFRFRNDTSEPFQLCAWCEGDRLCTELRSTVAPAYRYRLVEEDHHFHREENGKYYRISRIYRETIDPETGAVVSRELNWDNHSAVMFDPALIPPELIR